MTRQMWSISLDGAAPALADYPPGATFGPRILNSYELVWLISGRARWIWHDTGTQLDISPGDLLLLRPRMRDEFQWDDERPSRHGYVHFKLVAAEPDSSSDLLREAPPIRSLAAPSPFAGLLDYLVWLGEARESRWAERTEDVIGIIVRSFVDGPLPEPPAATEPPTLAAALEYVGTVWRNGIRPVSLTELAAAAGTSNAHLARTFKQHYGVGAVALLERVRLARAESLLTRSNLTISQIARACGFDDPLHFSKRFRSTYQRSPRAFRQTNGHSTSPLASAGLMSVVTRLLPADER